LEKVCGDGAMAVFKTDIERRKKEVLFLYHYLGLGAPNEEGDIHF